MKSVIATMFMVCSVCVSRSQTIGAFKMPVAGYFRPWPITDTLTKDKILRPELIPSNEFTRHLGFFCRMELKTEQIHIPVHFRLGSMEYCNRLEQKPGSGQP